MWFEKHERAADDVSVFEEEEEDEWKNFEDKFWTWI